MSTMGKYAPRLTDKYMEKTLGACCGNGVSIDGLELAVAVAQRVDLNLAEVTANRLGGGAVPGIACAPPIGDVIGVAEVLLHLQFEEGLEGCLTV